MCMLNAITLKKPSHGYKNFPAAMFIMHTKGTNCYRKSTVSKVIQKSLLSSYSIDALQALVDVVRQNKREALIAESVANIQSSSTFEESDAQYLVDIRKIDEAEEYLLKYAGQFNGRFYTDLLCLAQALKKEHRYLAASLLFRSVLMSILERGYAKAYHHGLDYLYELDELALSIGNFTPFIEHDIFKQQIIKAHFCKRNFWSNYKAST